MSKPRAASAEIPSKAMSRAVSSSRKRAPPGSRKADVPASKAVARPRASAVLGRAGAAGERATVRAKARLGSGKKVSKVAGKAAAQPKTRAGAKAKKLVAADPREVLTRLTRAIPRPHIELAFTDPWQLLVAVILSAQSTDRRVNLVTPELFRRWPTPAALAAAAAEEVEEVIKSTGFFRNKTKSIRGASQMLVDRFGGRVPRSMPELLDVPGVARKTANVVLGGAHGLSVGIVTDTHAMRVAQRLGLTEAETPEKIEADLCRQFPAECWLLLSHQLVLHGRYVCTARAPDCGGCPLNDVCPSRQAPADAAWTELAAYEAAEMERRAEGFQRAAKSV